MTSENQKPRFGVKVLPPEEKKPPKPKKKPPSLPRQKARPESVPTDVLKESKKSIFGYVRDMMRNRRRRTTGGSKKVTKKEKDELLGSLRRRGFGRWRKLRRL